MTMNKELQMQMLYKHTSNILLVGSAGEYACPMWHRSAHHAQEVDVALNETCRIITGCLKPTPLAAQVHLGRPMSYDLCPAYAVVLTQIQTPGYCETSS